MRLGAHVGTGGGLPTAVDRAMSLGCEAAQIFAANPSSWRSAALKPELVEQFRELVTEAGLNPIVVHTQYLINLASPEAELHEKSTNALADNMKRAQSIGAQYVVTHIGSHRGSGMEAGVAQIREAVCRALDGVDESVILLLENSAGAGNSIGCEIGHLRAVLDALGDCGSRVGVCLDSAHLWGAGYDLSTAASVDVFLDLFGATVGMERLRLLHLNDTNVVLGSHRDRHANVGTGLIGEEGLGAIVRHPLLSGLAGIIETPPGPADAEERDLDVLKRLRGY